jgi:DNA-binding MarR family transcriptional regulator
MGTVVSGKARPATSDVAGALIDAISSVRRAARRQAGRVDALSSLSAAEIELVRALRRHPGGSVAEMASELRLAPNTVSTLVGRLVVAGVVRREADLADRRVARLSLSPGLAQGMGEWVGRRAEALAVALEQLTPDDRAALVGAILPLQRLASALEGDGGGR